MKDICARKHKGAAESVAANMRRMPGDRGDVLRMILLRPSRGITCREVAKIWNVGMNTISGRFSELHRDGLIVKSGRRDGCAVWKEAK